MPQVDTLYGPLPQSLLKHLAKIKLLACDVDGVFSDGRIYLGQQGEELKAFHTRDGFGIKALRSAGVHVAVITGRQSAIVEQRMQALDVSHIIQGCHDKEAALHSLQRQLKVSTHATAAVGDDIPDMAMFNVSDLHFTVQDGHPILKQQAHYITHNRGGFGAVREICDLILLAKGKLHNSQGLSI
ncbi:MAG: 3-deoxy-manno-octulosonate-8-phosphatase KdsC [Paraglaciecola sp.]|nr:3-deoxy-manno-octulosonate-8-phosphatase KdsC [Paraglaciecola sp.]NCT46995.1 3-deoxy-manno-octulosonate-8-phosphatase KdsC [Paraglaciecola sp.]